MSAQRCQICGGDLQPELVTRAQPHQGGWVVIENLPALVCTQCGERFYTPDAHDLVVRLLAGQATPVRTETIQVYDAREAA